MHRTGETQHGQGESTQVEKHFAAKTDPSLSYAHLFNASWICLSFFFVNRLNNLVLGEKNQIL
jgi:hypothetical protein